MIPHWSGSIGQLHIMERQCPARVNEQAIGYRTLTAGKDRQLLHATVAPIGSDGCSE